MKISEAFEAYRNDYIFMGGQSERTAEMHNYVGKNIVEMVGDIDISLLTLESVRQWFNKISRERSQNTVRGYIIKLRRVLTYCKNREIRVLEPNLIQVPKRQESVPVFLYPEEVSAMIDASYNLRAKFVISLLYSSGIRLSELISLNRGQIYERRFTVVGKGGVPRLCFIDERTEVLMNDYLASRHDNDAALVVSYENKSRITKTNVQLIMRNSARNAKITKKVTPHTMRHTFATNFLRNGGNIRVLQILLGHKSVETTMMYTHIVDKDLEEQYLKHHTT